MNAMNATNNGSKWRELSKSRRIKQLIVLALRPLRKLRIPLAAQHRASARLGTLEMHASRERALVASSWLAPTFLSRRSSQTVDAGQV